MERKNQFLEQIAVLQTLYEQHLSEYLETIEQLRKEKVEAKLFTSEIKEENIKLHEELISLRESNLMLNEKVNSLRFKVKKNQQDFTKKIAQWEKVYQKCTCKKTNSTKQNNTSAKRDISKIFFASPEVNSVTRKRSPDQHNQFSYSTFDTNSVVNNALIVNDSLYDYSDVDNSSFDKTTSPSLISNSILVTNSNPDTNSVSSNTFSIVSSNVPKTISSEFKMPNKASLVNCKSEADNDIVFSLNDTAKPNKEKIPNKNSGVEYKHGNNLEISDSMNSKKPYFKFDDPVRTKKLKEQLEGFTCAECEAFYKSDNLSKNQLKDILKNCSRHKRKFSPPPATQPEFWNIDFPDTQQYIKKGYMLDENCALPDSAKPKWHNKKLNVFSGVTKAGKK